MSTGFPSSYSFYQFIFHVTAERILALQMKDKLDYDGSNLIILM